jgi:hypothetical protein
MRLDAAVQLVYRREEDRAASSKPVLADRTALYPEPSNTGTNLSLLVEASVLSGEIGVYADGRLVGSGVIVDGLAGIAVWGDDPTTAAVDGAVSGDPLELRFRDASGERALTSKLIEGDLTYQTNGLAVVQATSLAAPAEFGLTGAYPNPFNSTISISYGLAGASQVSLRVFDLAGREVVTLAEGKLSAGSYSVVWKAEGMASGIYLVKLETPSLTMARKIVLAK